MTQQLGDGRIVYLQARSAHDAEPSRSAEQAEDVSGALAFTAGAHSDRRFASVFVTGADGLRLHVRSYGYLASLPRFQLCAYLVSPALQPTFIPWQWPCHPTLPSRGLCWRSIIVAPADPGTFEIPTTKPFP